MAMKEYKPKYKREGSMLFKKFRERGDYFFVYENKNLKTLSELITAYERVFKNNIV